MYRISKSGSVYKVKSKGKSKRKTFKKKATALKAARKRR